MLYRKLIGTAIASLITVVTIIAAASDVPEEAALPEVIVVGEAQYRERQQELEGAMHRFFLSTMDRSPEERRELMEGWMDANQKALEDQAAYSNMLDTLYNEHHIPPPPDQLAQVEASRPETAAEMASPAGRRWELERQMAEIRRAHMDDPDGLRDSMHAWFEANGEALEEAQQEERSAHSPNASSLEDTAEHERLAIIPPPGADPSLLRYFELNNLLLDISDADPPPLNGNGSASIDEMDAWRARAAQTMEPVVRELDDLNQQLSASRNTLVAKENKYEIGK